MKNKMRGLVVTFALVGLAAAGCAGGGSKSSSGGTSKGQFSSAKEIIDTAATKGLTCTDASDDNGELFTRDGWRCTVADGDTVTAHTFSDNGLRDKWIEAAKQYGGNFVSGDKWAVTADSPALALQVQAAVGGKTL